jgi:hypothetical protein
MSMPMMMQYLTRKESPTNNHRDRMRKVLHRRENTIKTSITG